MLEQVHVCHSVLIWILPLGNDIHIKKIRRLNFPITNRVTDLSRSIRTVPRRVSQLYKIPQDHLWSVRTNVKMTKRYIHVKRYTHLRCICIRHSSKEAARTLCSVIYLRYIGWRINIILNSFFRLDEVDLGRIIEKQRVYIYNHPRLFDDIPRFE